MSKLFTPASAIAGFAVGLRSLLPLAVTLASAKSPWTGLTGTLAAGEMLADKLPIVPARTQPVVLAERALVGALCGAMLAERRGACRTAGAVVGAAGAVAGSFGGYYARKFVGTELGIQDPVVAVAEDGIAFGLARLANA